MAAASSRSGLLARKLSFLSIFGALTSPVVMMSHACDIEACEAACPDLARGYRYIKRGHPDAIHAICSSGTRCLLTDKAELCWPCMREVSSRVPASAVEMNEQCRAFEVAMATQRASMPASSALAALSSETLSQDGAETASASASAVGAASASASSESAAATETALSHSSTSSTGVEVQHEACPNQTSPAVSSLTKLAEFCFLRCPKVCQPLDSALRKENVPDGVRLSEICFHKNDFLCLYDEDNWSACQRLVETTPVFGLSMPISRSLLDKACQHVGRDADQTEMTTSNDGWRSLPGSGFQRFVLLLLPVFFPILP
mmetsp:Transcript_45328/g.97181  ORF Transcript_45328/g.97181 Transcript_45328/m.97181 type:complete len:317 (+) Transcript_45328:82-1032(+)